MDKLPKYIDEDRETYGSRPPIVQGQPRRVIPLKLCWVVTHVCGAGYRTITSPHTYFTREDAESTLAAWTGPNGLCKVLTAAQMTTLRVTPTLCYDHGDPVRTIFPDEGDWY